MLYAALVPLLPHFEHRYGLTKGGVGALAAAYAIGTFARCGAPFRGSRKARVGLCPAQPVTDSLGRCAACSLSSAPWSSWTRCCTQHSCRCCRTSSTVTG